MTAMVRLLVQGWSLTESTKCWRGFLSGLKDLGLFDIKLFTDNKIPAITANKSSWGLRMSMFKTLRRQRVRS